MMQIALFYLKFDHLRKWGLNPTPRISVVLCILTHSTSSVLYAKICKLTIFSILIPLKDFKINPFDFAYYSISNQKSNLHYTCGITQKRVTMAGFVPVAHRLDNTAPKERRSDGEPLATVPI